MSVLCFGMYQDGLECSAQPSFMLSLRYVTADDLKEEDNAVTVSLAGSPIIPLEEGSATWSAGYSGWTSSTTTCSPGSPTHDDAACPDEYDFSDVTTTNQRERDRSTYTGMLTLSALYDIISDKNWDLSLGGTVGVFTRRIDLDTQRKLGLATYLRGEEVSRWDQEDASTDSREVSGLGVAGTAQARVQLGIEHEYLGFNLFPACLSVDVAYGGVLNGFKFDDLKKEGFEVYEVSFTYQGNIP